MANKINWNQNGEELSAAINQFVKQLEGLGKSVATQAGNAIAQAENDNKWSLPFGLSTAFKRTPQQTLARAVKKELASYQDGAAVSFVFAAIFAVAVIGLGIARIFVNLGRVMLLMPIFALMAAALTYVGVKTYRQSKKIKTVQGFLTVLGEREGCTVAALSAGTGTSEREVLKLLDEGMQKGYLAGLYLSADGKRVLVGSEAYENDAAQNPVSAQSARTGTQSTGASTSGNPEVDALLRQGREFVEELAALAGKINDPEILGELGDICNISQQIFTQVAAAPEKAPQIRKFMTYYLPTTIKLVSTYTEVDETGVNGENASAIKANIKNVLGTMRTSFTSLLDGLFMEEALDISTDITVLKTLLAEEGLVDEGFQL